MAEAKITKKEYFENILQIINTIDADNKNDLIDFINHEIELIESKAAKAKERAEKNKQQSDELTVKIENKLSADWQTSDDITTAINEEDVTRSKVIARLSQLVKNGKVEKQQGKIENRKVMTYRLMSAISQD